VMLLGSGSIRVPELGPLVTLKELTEMFPFQEEVIRITVTGRQLKDMIAHIFRPGALEDDHAEFYQFSRGMKVVVSLSEQRVTEISYDGAPIDDDRLFRVGIQTYHYKNMEEFLGVSEAEAAQNAPVKTLATSTLDVLDENLSRMELVVCPEDARWITLP
ncbi:MAG: 5'-nucleotidase C-terminal domain-containing protein, partial [Clostridium sp.]|nr:5'-nucleotidase C-terminal domain-containing protein [Clostridium sp.]